MFTVHYQKIDRWGKTQRGQKQEQTAGAAFPMPALPSAPAYFLFVAGIVLVETKVRELTQRGHSSTSF